MLACVTEIVSLKREKKKNLSIAAVAIIFLPLVFSSCSSGPEPIQLGKEACDHCKMTISDPRYGGEIVTAKGKVYKFDDLGCLTSFMSENSLSKADIKDIYAVNFSGDHNLVRFDEHLLLFKCDQLHTPMNGNTAAFDNSDSLAVLMKQYKKGIPLNWDELIR